MLEARVIKEVAIRVAIHKLTRIMDIKCWNGFWYAAATVVIIKNLEKIMLRFDDVFLVSDLLFSFVLALFCFWFVIVSGLKHRKKKIFVKVN